MEITQKIMLVACVGCGRIPETLENFRKNDGGDFFCPNGHVLKFSKDKTISQLNQELYKLEEEKINLSKELEVLKRTNITLQAKIDQLEAEIATNKKENHD